LHLTTMTLTTENNHMNRLRRLSKFPKMMLWAFWMEGVETRQMVQTFARQGRGKIIRSYSGRKPTPEELAQAREQLRDIPKFLPFFICVVVPLPGVTEGYVVMAITLESWLGNKVSLLPSNFRNIFRKNQEESAPEPSLAELAKEVENIALEPEEKDKTKAA
jgi:hypothetical protein